MRYTQRSINGRTWAVVDLQTGQPVPGQVFDTLVAAAMRAYNLDLEASANAS